MPRDQVLGVSRKHGASCRKSRLSSPANPFRTVAPPFSQAQSTAHYTRTETQEKSTLAPGTYGVLGIGRGTDGARSGLCAWPQREVRGEAALGQATRRGGLPADQPGWGRTATMGTRQSPGHNSPFWESDGSGSSNRSSNARSGSAQRIVSWRRARSRWLRDWRRVPVSTQAAGAWAPLAEAWRWLRRPAVTWSSGVALRRPLLSAAAAERGWGAEPGGRGAALLRRGRCLRGCGPTGGCGDSRPVRAGPRPLPQERAGGGGAGRGPAGRALGREQ